MDLSKPKKLNETQNILIQKKGTPVSSGILSRCTYPRSHYFSGDSSSTEISEIANKIASNLNAKNEIREQILMFQDLLTYWPEGVTSQTITWTDWSESYVPFERTENLTKKEVENLIIYLEDKLHRMNDALTDLNFQLQQAMNDQAQIMQMHSSIMKAQHDTLKSIISNLR